MSEPRDVLIRHAGRRRVQGGAVSFGRAGRGRTECRHWSEGGRWIRPERLCEGVLRKETEVKKIWKIFDVGRQQRVNTYTTEEAHQTGHRP